MGAENAVQSREVEVGGRSYTVARFRGFKAQQVLRLVAKIGKAYPQLAEQAAAFERAYIEDNQLLLSRAEAELRFGDEAREISDEAWKESGGIIGRKRMPSSWERFAAMWPDLLEAAERPTMELLAVISLTNEELADADESDSTEKTIVERRRKLLREGEAEQLVELAIAGVEVARGQFAPLAEKALPLLETMMMGGLGQMVSSTSPDPEEPPNSSTTSNDSETSPSSSTDSPPATGGPESKPSDPPGSSSDDSQES